MLPDKQKAFNSETYEHIIKVQGFIFDLINRLMKRALGHDQSKLASPEVELLAELGPELRGTTYGSPEYKELLEKLKPALDHHYANNKHHPEHYENGIDGMDLVDLMEMLADWKAATLKHNDGNLNRSIEYNTERFGISAQLANILKNTAERMEWF